MAKAENSIVGDATAGDEANEDGYGNGNEEDNDEDEDDEDEDEEDEDEDEDGESGEDEDEDIPLSRKAKSRSQRNTRRKTTYQKNTATAQSEAVLTQAELTRWHKIDVNDALRREADRLEGAAHVAYVRDILSYPDGDFELWRLGNMAANRESLRQLGLANATAEPELRESPAPAADTQTPHISATQQEGSDSQSPPSPPALLLHTTNATTAELEPRKSPAPAVDTQVRQGSVTQQDDSGSQSPPSPPPRQVSVTQQEDSGSQSPPSPPPRLFHTANPDGWPTWLERCYTHLTSISCSEDFEQAVVTWTEYERMLKFQVRRVKYL